MGRRGEILFDSLMSKSEEKIMYDLEGDPDCLVASIDSKIFYQSSGGSLETTVEKSAILQGFQKSSIFSSFSEAKINTFIEYIEIEKYENGKKITKQGESSRRTFFIVKKGKADSFVDSKASKTYKVNDSFGEMAFINNSPFNSSIQANGSVELYCLNWSDKFSSNISPYLLDYITKKAATNGDEKIELKDLDYIAVIGKGTYGICYLVRSKKTKCYYAIKSICKSQIFYDRLAKAIDLEREILTTLDSPFIVKLIKGLKSKSHIFFLMEYIRGKELFEVIRDIGVLNQYQTQFFIGCILLAVELLHSKKIIHRDIKPENIMVLENGYLKLIDFGTVKKITDRTNSIVGTPHYMAPEVILGEGYSFSVDIWSIGIMMFEFVDGNLPFAGADGDMMEIYKDIIKGDLKWSEHVKGKKIKNIISMMLNKNVSNRLQNTSQIKSHPFFEQFDWDGLMNLNLEPPFPISVDLKDMSVKENFTNFVNSLVDYKPTEKELKNKEAISKLFPDFEKWFKDF